MTKRKRSILLAVVISVLCISMAAAGTYALFTDDADVKTHLQAGKLDLKLERIHLDKWYIDPLTGGFANKVSEDPVNFSEETDKNVFDMTDKEIIVPLSSYAAKMRITNNGNVAFRYWIDILVDDAGGKDLSDQIYVTVEYNGGKIEGYLNEVLKQIGSEASPISTVYIKDETDVRKNYEDFTISIMFMDSEATDDLIDGSNNNAMNQSVKVDVIVHAVQVTPQTQPATPPQQP